MGSSPSGPSFSYSVQSGSLCEDDPLWILWMRTGPHRDGTISSQLEKSESLQSFWPVWTPLALVCVSRSVMSDSLHAHGLLSLSVEFSRQESWSGYPFPSAGYLPDPGIELGSPALPAGSSPSEPPVLFGASADGTSGNASS